MAENEFILSPLVTENFDEKSRKKFLVKYRLYSEYSRSGQDFHFFVQENIQNGRIDKNDLAQYLFEELLYGNQRLIHMYDLYSYNDSYKNGAELISRIQTYYSSGTQPEKRNRDSILTAAVIEEARRQTGTTFDGL